MFPSLRKLASLGIEASTPPERALRAQFVNILSLMVIGCVIPFVPIFYALGGWIAGGALGCIGLYGITLELNRRRRCELANAIFLLNSSLTVGAYTLVFGADLELAYVLVATAIYPFVVYGVQRWRAVLAGVALSMGTFFLVEWGAPLLGIAPAPVGLEDFAREIAETVTPLVERHGNTLHIERDPTLESAHTDPTRLRQIALNLISNAAKFTQDGTITLRLRPTSDPTLFTLEVEDTGQGIAPEAQEHIFEAFEQETAQISASHGGTGLGLALVRQFAELMGGGIELESEPGQGALFRVQLARRLEPQSE